MKKYIFSILRGVGYGIGFALVSMMFSSCSVKAEVLDFSNPNVSIGSSTISTSQTNIWIGYMRNARIPEGTYTHFRFNLGNEILNKFGNNISNYDLYFILSIYNTDSVSGSAYSFPFLQYGNSVGIPIQSYSIDNKNSGPNDIVIYKVSRPSNYNLNIIYAILDNGSAFSGTSNYTALLSKVFYYPVGQTDKALSDINDSINKVEDSINNSDISGSSSTAGDFFNGFENESHGISGIVTAPLKLINSFNSDSCTAVVFSIWGKEFNLPCGTDFFNRSDIKPFIDIFNIIVGGLISYGAVRGIFKKIEDLKNPDDSKVEVIDL